MNYCLPYLLLVALLIGCRTEQDSKTYELESAIQQIIQRSATQQHQKITLLDVDLISYETIDQNHIDSLRSNWYHNSYEHFKALENAHYLSGTKSYAPDLQKIKQGNVAYDSARYYFKKDSLLKQSMRTRSKSLKDSYKVKFICKADIDGHQSADTLSVILDHNLKSVEIDK